MAKSNDEVIAEAAREYLTNQGIGVNTTACQKVGVWNAQVVLTIVLEPSATGYEDVVRSVTAAYWYAQKMVGDGRFITKVVFSRTDWDRRCVVDADVLWRYLHDRILFVELLTAIQDSVPR